MKISSRDIYTAIVSLSSHLSQNYIEIHLCSLKILEIHAVTVGHSGL